MKYIRTEDGRIINIQEFIDNEKNNPYYEKHKFEKIKNENGECVIRWSAVGTEENSMKEQRGQRCQFCARVDSPFVKQSNKLEDLCDEKVIVWKDKSRQPSLEKDVFIDGNERHKSIETIYGAIWNGKGLVYVAKMNDKGELELL